MKLFISKLHYKLKLNIFEKIVVTLLSFCSVFYAIIVFFRNKLYDFKCLKSYNSSLFIISVGNLTTGGVGKTPVVMALANYFVMVGKKVSIISRGYNGSLSNKKPNIISSNGQILYSPEEAGDEPIMLAENCKGVSVITCASRVNAVKLVEKQSLSDVVILDDAFQHRKIKRNINLVLIDAKNKFGNNKLLPAGPLRENLSEIKRADKIIIVNKDIDNVNALKYCDEVSKLYSKPVFLCQIIPDYAYDIVTGEQLAKSSKVIAFSAIGQSEGFYNFVKKNYRLQAILELEDHHQYTKTDIEQLIKIAQHENIENLITTEKDAVKINALLDGMEIPVKVFALKLKVSLDIKEICDG